jgi:hypothetical protein
MDDWSIIRTSQVLETTGHIRFNGWESPTLGWLPFLGAFTMKLFGFSYTMPRVAMVGVSCALIVLLQRLFIRAGVSDWNALLGATTMAVSPIFLMTGVTFMTDVPGVLAIVACLYACIRAVQAGSPTGAFAWMSIASLTNAVLGSVRQSSWLGLFVMVPCALWLIRRRRVVVVASAAVWLASLGIVAIVLYWFKHQSYVLPVELFPGKLSPEAVVKAAWVIVRMGLELLLLILPVPLAFLTVVRGAGFRKNRAVVVLALLMVSGLFILLRFRSGQFLAPYLLFGAHQQTLQNIFFDFPPPILGPAPVPLTTTFRFVCTLLIQLAVFAILYLFVEQKSLRQPIDEGAKILPWYSLLVLVVPFSAAYFAILLPRAVFLYAVDRYLLPVMPVALLLLMRLNQRFVTRRMPRFEVVLLALFALYSVTILHDAFAAYRANLVAINELRMAGVPRSSIGGGVEYNLDTELLQNGFVPYPGVRLQDSKLQQSLGPLRPGGSCEDPYLILTPAVHPVYSVAYAESGCQKAAAFPSIYFKTWLLPRTHEVEVIKSRPTPVQ